MHDDVPKNNIASENMNLFYDLELILGYMSSFLCF